MSHWHISYCEDTNEFSDYIEATGFLNAYKTWDVYYDDTFKEEHNNLFKYYPTKRDDIVGIYLFTVKDDKEGEKKFNEGVKNIYHPFLKTKT